MKCPSCKKALSYEDAIDRNEWEDKKCPFCDAPISMTMGISPATNIQWRLVTPEDEAQIAKMRSA